jgi:hypothetical protein
VKICEPAYAPAELKVYIPEDSESITVQNSSLAEIHWVNKDGLPDNTTCTYESSYLRCLIQSGIITSRMTVYFKKILNPFTMTVVNSSVNMTFSSKNLNFTQNVEFSATYTIKMGHSTLSRITFTDPLTNRTYRILEIRSDM